MWKLGLLPPLAIVNNSTVNMGVQIYLSESLVLILLSIYPKVELLDNRTILFLMF